MLPRKSLSEYHFKKYIQRCQVCTIQCLCYARFSVVWLGSQRSFRLPAPRVDPMTPDSSDGSSDGLIFDTPTHADFWSETTVGCILAILQFRLAEYTVDKLFIASLFLEPKVTPHFTFWMSRQDKLCFFKVVNMSLCSRTCTSASSHCTLQKLTQHVSLTVYVTVNFLCYVMLGTSIITFPNVLID